MAVNQLKAGAILNYVILALNALIGFIYVPYMLRMLGQSEYGIYSLAASVIAYLSMLDFGFGNAVIRYTAKYRAANDRESQYSMFGMFTLLYSAIGIISFVAGLILYFQADEIFGQTLTPDELDKTRNIILLMVLNLAITFPLSIYGAIITAYENFVFLRVMTIIKTVLSTVIIVALLYWGYKAFALVVVKTVFNIGVLLLNVFYCKKKLKIRVVFNKSDKSLLKEIIVYSLWIFLIMIMDKIYWSTGQFILGAVSGAIAISVYAVAIQLQQIYMMFSGAISSVFLPKVTAIVTTGNDKKVISDLFIRTGRLQYIVLSYVLTGFIIFGEPFIRFWAGLEYKDAYIITLLFFIPLTIPLIQNLGLSILQARNQMKFRALMFLCVAMVALAAQIPLAKLYDGFGCALAVALALIVGQGFIMNVYYYKRQFIDIISFWKEIGKMSILPVVICFAGYFTFELVEINTVWQLVGYIIVFSLIYIPLFWRFSMNESERQLLGRPIVGLLHRISHREILKNSEK